MKQAKDYVETTKPIQSPEAPVQTAYGEREMAEKLLKAMSINYGSIFKAELDSEQAQEMWVTSWTASLRGKSPENVVSALKHCMDTHPRPFTRADFQQAYRALQQRPESITKRQPLGLPSKTWQERREIGRKHLDKLKEILK